MSDSASLPPITEPLDESSGRALVEAWRSSGLNGASYCRQHDIRPQRLHYWRERLGYPIKVVGEARRTTVACPPAVHGFVQMVVGERSASRTTAIEIIVDGAVVRVHADADMVLLRTIVHALRAEG
jgi:hypothetical protein